MYDTWTSKLNIFNTNSWVLTLTLAWLCVCEQIA